MNDKPSAKYPFIDPSRAVVLRDRLIKDHKLSGAKEDWVIVNARLMEDLGTKVWLNQFLDAISLPHTKYDGHDIISPYYVIVVSESLSSKPKTSTTPAEWVAANEKLVSEVGPAGWLWMLLDVLETGSAKSE